MSIDYSRDPDVLRLQRRDITRILDGRAQRTQRRPCVCSGYVTADPIDPTPGVRQHNATLAHKAWREENGR